MGQLVGQTLRWSHSASAQATCSCPSELTIGLEERWKTIDKSKEMLKKRRDADILSSSVCDTLILMKEDIHRAPQKCDMA